MRFVEWVTGDPSRGGNPRAVGVLSLSAVILIVLLIPFVSDGERPGIGAQTELRGDRWVVIAVDQGGIANRADIRTGDVIVKLDGKMPGRRDRADPGLKLDGTRRWTIMRDGSILHVLVTGHENMVGPLLLLLTGLGFWVIALLIRLARPRDPLVHWLYWMNMSMAGVLALNSPAQLDVAWSRVVEVACFSVLPALFLWSFTWLAAGIRPRGRVTWMVRTLFLLGVGTGALYVVAGFRHSSWFDALASLLLALVILGFLGGLVSLARAYLLAPAEDTRRRMEVILAGTAAAVLPVTALSIVPVVVWGTPIIPAHVAALSTICLPLSLAYAVVRHRLLGIDIVIARTLVYGLMTALLTVAYALLLPAIAHSPFDRSIPDLALTVGFFVVMTLSFTFIRDRLHIVIDQLIYRDRYDYVRTLRLLGAQLASVAPMDGSLTEVVELLSRTMNLTGAAILLRAPDGTLAVRAACGSCLDGSVQATLVREALDRSEPANSPHWIELVANDDDCGSLYLGRKRTHAQLTETDVSFAEAVAHQAAVVVANAVLVERLRGKVLELELLRDRLMHVEEDGRKRVAQDLHDGALHSVLEIGRRIDALATEREVTGVRVWGEAVWNLVELCEAAAYELRAVCSDLYPSELADLGLVPALEDLARQMSRNEQVEVRLERVAFPQYGRLRSEVEDALYRVAREVLSNVVRHANASHAQMRLARCGDDVFLVIWDDGTGFSVPSSASKLVRLGHFGIATMRERMEAVGGTLTISSGCGAGTEVHAHVPSEAWVDDAGIAANSREMRAHANSARR